MVALVTRVTAASKSVSKMPTVVFTTIVTKADRRSDTLVSVPVLGQFGRERFGLKVLSGSEPPS